MRLLDFLGDTRQDSDCLLSLLDRLLYSRCRLDAYVYRLILDRMSRQSRDLQMRLGHREVYRTTCIFSNFCHHLSLLLEFVF